MPYIKPEEREDILIHAEFVADACDTPGKLNFAITVMLHKRLQLMGKSYTTAVELLSTMEAAKLEFYRRVMAPYEDVKAEENGDVLLSDGTNMAQT